MRRCALLCYVAVAAMFDDIEDEDFYSEPEDYDEFEDFEEYYDSNGEDYSVGDDPHAT